MTHVPQPNLTRTLTDQDGERFVLEKDAKELFAELSYKIARAEEAMQYFVDRVERPDHPDGRFQSTKTYHIMTEALQIIRSSHTPLRNPS
jgi:hypothetical protein